MGICSTSVKTKRLLVQGGGKSVLRVIETAARTIRPDAIDRTPFAQVSWAPDGGSFFYSRPPAHDPHAGVTAAYSHPSVYRHALSTDLRRDTLILDADQLPFRFEALQAIPGC